jgi:hypothetical protein
MLCKKNLKQGSSVGNLGLVLWLQFHVGLSFMEQPCSRSLPYYTSTVNPKFLLLIHSSAGDRVWGERE